MFAEDKLKFRGDWEDICDVRDNYLPEVEALVRREVPGASHPDAKVRPAYPCFFLCRSGQTDRRREFMLLQVLIFDHAIRTHLRNVRQKNTVKPDHMWGMYANTVLCALYPRDGFQP
jgi:hypothetical protein